VTINDPFPCSTTTLDGPCGNRATHVYRSAVITRLVCDACARSYRRPSSARIPAPHAPTAEVAILELIPAREVLLAERDKFKAQSEDSMAKANAIEVAWQEAQLDRDRAVALIQLGIEEKRRMDRLAIWSEGVGILVGLVVGWRTDQKWGLAAAFVVGLVWYGLGRWWMQRYWTTPRLSMLNATSRGLQ
jgi:hypothetical protein